MTKWDLLNVNAIEISSEEERRIVRNVPSVICDLSIYSVIKVIVNAHKIRLHYFLEEVLCLVLSFRRSKIKNADHRILVLTPNWLIIFE